MTAVHLPVVTGEHDPSTGDTGVALQVRGVA